eukprot:Selendium_serpulae@DN4958_c0_g1_i1.p1
MSILQKIADIEAEMAKTQRNKATESHFAVLKARIAKLRSQLIEGGAKGGGGSASGFDVQKTGDARVGLLGFPSVGKSTLMTKLTGTFSEVAAYEFTTLTCVPGVFRYKGAKVQLLDLPGIIEGAKDGKGRGKQVIGVARTCSMVLVVLDAMKPLTHKRLIEKEVEGFGIRLNKTPPNITITRKDKGGISVNTAQPLKNLDEDTIKSICHEYRISNAQIQIRCDATCDDLIDTIEGRAIYLPCIYVINKIDQVTIEELDILSKCPHYVPISAHHEWNLEGLIEKMWEYMSLIRIYTKPRGQIPDYYAPVILKVQGGQCTVGDFCKRIHRQLLSDFKYALVWGTSAKHNPQKVGKDHTLNDEDVVQIVKKLAG